MRGESRSELPWAWQEAYLGEIFDWTYEQLMSQPEDYVKKRLMIKQTIEKIKNQIQKQNRR